MNTLIPGAPLRSLSPTSNEYQRAEGVSRAAKPARVARFTLDAPEHSGTIPGARGDILTPGVALTSNLAVIFTLNQHSSRVDTSHRATTRTYRSRPRTFPPCLVAPVGTHGSARSLYRGEALGAGAAPSARPATLPPAQSSHRLRSRAGVLAGSYLPTTAARARRSHDARWCTMRPFLITVVTELRPT